MPKLTINIPDVLLKFVEAEAEQYEVSKGFVIIDAIKDRYAKQTPTMGEVVQARDFWPSGWPHAKVIAPYEYCGTVRGPWCNRCDREHDPMEHEDNDTTTLELVRMRHEQGIIS